MKNQFQSDLSNPGISIGSTSKWRRHLHLGALIALVSVGGMLLPGCGRTEVKATTESMRVVRAFHVDSSPRSSEFSSRFTGVIRARTESNLGFRVGGKISERLVNAGDVVKLGQPLMKLDPTDYQLALQAARAVQKQTELELERVRILVEKRAESRDTLERALAAATASAAQADQLANQASYTILYADADGIVMSTLAEPGQVVGTGQPVLVLAKDGRREAAVDIPENLLERIRGGTATAHLYLNSELVVPATLREISGVADPVARTFQARYVLEGEAARFALGATVTVHVSEGGEAQSMYEVPLGSLIDRGEGAAVWVIDPKTSAIAKRAVSVAKLGAETASISHGLQRGDLVVALGAQLLNAGEVVRVKEVK
jgi:RND family efflux transporter MFP subunit